MPSMVNTETESGLHSPIFVPGEDTTINACRQQRGYKSENRN